jgi:multisubunit Na+/H+ antiporter MnhG subunit
MKWDLKSLLTVMATGALIIFVGVLLVMLFVKNMITSEIAVMLITAFVLLITNIANYYFTKNKNTVGKED